MKVLPKFSFSKKIYGKNTSVLIFIFPHWKSKKYYYWYLTKKLSKKYKVVLYNYSSSLLSSDIKNVKNNFKFIVEDTNKSIREIRKEGHSDIVLIGFSLGSMITYMIARKNTSPVKIINISAISNFAKNIWCSNKTRRIKKNLIEKGVTLENLEKEWKELSPMYEMRSISADSKIVLSDKDIVACYQLGLDLIEKFKRIGRSPSAIKHRYLSHELLLLLYFFKTDYIFKFLKK